MSDKDITTVLEYIEKEEMGKIVLKERRKENGGKAKKVKSLWKDITIPWPTVHSGENKF